jgi:hypothetical protein
MRRLAWFLLAVIPATGQTPVAPTNEPVGPKRGQEIGDYVITNSFEVGYRFLDVNGNESRYRSDVNYGNGIRLLDNRLTVNSKDGRGRLFDSILLTTLGLGNDPYQNAMLQVEKNRWYRYDFQWRSIAYYNPALSISFGEHFMNTVRNMQDQNLVLLPQSKIRFLVGYSRVSQSGPGLTTVQEFNSQGNEFPLASNIRRWQNDIRVGNEFQLFGVRVSWLRSWEMFNDETQDTLNNPEPGNVPGSGTTLTQFNRVQPYKGTTPTWRVNLFREQGKYWGLNGKFTNSAGRRNFSFDETALGANRFGPQNQQILVGGNAQRPVTTASLTVSLYPTESLTVTNYTLFNNTRMTGNAQYQQLQNADLQLSTVNFQYLGIRNITNATTVNWNVRSWLALYGGYQYADRKVGSVQDVTIDGDLFPLNGQQTNILNAGTAGFQLRPYKSFTLALDGEVGRNSHPIYPVSEKNYEGINGRAQYRTKSLLLSALVRSNYNLNSVSLFSHSARVRQYSFDGSWAAPGGLSVEAGYDLLQTHTATGIAYFLDAQFVPGQQSIYLSNLHVVHLGLRGSIRQRVDWYAGYSRTQDTGGNSNQGPPLPAFRLAQSFPMTFESPMARVSVRITERIRWNAGYQFYHYLETTLPQQNYGANTGYTSVLWSF